MSFPLPSKKKGLNKNRSPHFLAKENWASAGTNLCFKCYKDVWVTTVGVYFPSLRNPLWRTVLNLDFQHLFTLFHSDSLIVSLAYPLYFLRFLQPLLLTVPQLAVLIYHSTPRLTIPDSCYCPIEPQCHATSNSSCLALMQALHLEPKLMATIDLTHCGSEFSKNWPWPQGLCPENLCSVINSYLPSHLQRHPALPCILISPQWLMQKLLFLPLYFHTSFYKLGKALGVPTPNSASANPLGSSWRDTDPTLSYIFLFPYCSCFSPVWNTEADNFCLCTVLLTVPNLKPSYCIFFQYLCRKITGSTFLQLMQNWLEGNSSKWPHPWPQLDM